MRKSITRLSMRWYALVLFMVSAFAANAQNQVTGHVTDATGGYGIQAITVSVKGSAVATQTNADGNFSIAVPANGTLVFTSVNYTTLSVPVGGRSFIEVSLQQATQKLSEVVVIGYGSTKKKDLSGSITQVSAKDFQSGQITSPEQLISGKVAGVQIVSNGGAPGAGSTIRIRGGASLSASNDPLIVLDGVPLSNSSIPGTYSPLNMINPNDIESFSILKDASATAIYGSRASNGVIIITTKKGRANSKPVFNFNTTFSVSDISRRADVLSADKVRSIVYANGDPKFINLLGNANTDWQKLIYQTALSTDNNLSVSGGFKNVPYRISAGYLNQEGILKTGSLQRYSGGINVSPSLLDNHLKIDFNIKGSIADTRFANQDAIGAAVYFDPTKPVYSGNSRYNGFWEWTDPASSTGLRALGPKNPLGLLLSKVDRGQVKRSIGNALIDYKVHFLPDLHAFVNLGYDIARSNGTVFINDSAASNYKRSPDGKYGGVNNKYSQERNDKLLETYLTYTKSIAVTSKLDLVAGYAYQDFKTTVHNYADYYANDSMAPNSKPTFAIDYPRYTLISYYGRANLNLMGKYILTGTIRTDGSSKFAKDQRWGVFPSGAFAWNIKNEKFLENSNTVSDLKLRVGYGLTGQQSGIGYYDYNSFYNLSSNTSQYQLGLDSFYHLYAPSGYYPQRTWEKTATSNLGLDYGFAKGRITGSIDVYYKKTTDLLNNIAQPAGSNFSNQIVANVGSMENKGIEFSINLQPIKNSHLVWDIGFNATYNETKILKLSTVNNPDFPGNVYQGISGGTGNTILINSVNYPQASFYVYKQVYDKGGLPIDGLFEDLNRDGIINEKDLYQYKSANPDYLLGATTNFNFDNKLNIGFVMRASIGNYMYNNNISSTSTYNSILSPLNWIGNGIAYNLLSGKSDKTFLSDYYIQNASFLKMDNAYISYRVGKILRDKASLTLNGNIQNVFTITNYIGLDPEIQSGVDNNFYPRPRVYSLGLNLTF
ncbi:MAG: SusC/RagA family TonB-linked outer membrane protein [Bacteroidetes bacterium]|nr:SusC/RagA family TonB-linked outer membrane protein [Bacteroidota bacterium]